MFFLATARFLFFKKIYPNAKIYGSSVKILLLDYFQTSNFVDKFLQDALLINFIIDCVTLKRIYIYCQDETLPSIHHDL